MRVLLMSTPDFGRPTLRALLDRGYEVVGLVCQPDKPAGRGLRPLSPPMKRVAQAYGVPVFQPASLAAAEAAGQVAAARPDLILVAAYGKFIPDSILALAAAGALNLHPSLLPRWRGACPVPAAILAGDRETGVTVHFVVNEMDAGAILAQAALPITERDRAGDLMARLADLGAGLYVTALEEWLAGRIAPREQDHAAAVWCDRLHKAQGRLAWSQPAERLARQVRAFDPWPGAFTDWRGALLHVLDAEAWPDWRGDLAPGQVFRARDTIARDTVAGDAIARDTIARDRIAVATGQGALILHLLQAAGKRALPAPEFCRGQRDFVGATLT